MTPLPLHAVPVILNDQLNLRVYRAGKLEIEMPLRSRQALVLAAQLLNYALAADLSTAGTDGRMLEPPGE